jgi:hypothetical protein
MEVRFYGEIALSKLVHLPPGYHPAPVAAEGAVRRMLDRGVERGEILGYFEDGETCYFGAFERRDGGGVDLANWLRELEKNRLDALERC